MKAAVYDLLPVELQTRVNEIIKDHRFADYTAMTAAINAALADAGFQLALSRSTVHNIATGLKQVLDQIRYTQEAASYLCEAFPDGDRSVSQASIRLIQDRLFRLAMEQGTELSPKELSAIARAMSDLVRADISDSKYRDEVRSRVEVAAQETTELLRKEGISDETAAMIRAKFLGVAG